MKVLIDPEIFFYGRCGMVRYYSRLIKELKNEGLTIDIPLLLSESDFINGSLQPLQWFRKIPGGRYITNRLNTLSKKIYYRKIQKGNYDILFINSPVFEDRFLDYMPAHKPFAMVVHDTMRCVLGPDGLFDPSGSNADKLAYLTHRASGVISISHTTCKDLADLTGLSETDITTIHTGNLLNTELETSNNLSLPSQYLLFVGDRTGRKNFKLFISAITDILQAQLELHVVCTGPCNKWEYDMLCKLQVADKVQFIEANDQVLVSLYKNAKALIYPSIYEGYGLPVLEAMSLGCPVITSRLSSIPEVGKDAVIYIDPYQKISIATAVNQVLHAEKSWLSDLTDKAMQIAMQQTPQKMASLFKTAFETVVQNSYKKSKA